MSQETYVMQRQGFTLVELSIVLVILGLLVGGVLAGQNLIRAAALKSQITQIDSYKAAVFQFKDKYFALPGDISHTLAASLGFIARDGSRGSGDADGHLEGYGGFPTRQTGGEPVLFWADLAQAELIDGTFTSANGTSYPASSITSDFDEYYPTSKLDGQAIVYAWSGSKGAGNTYVLDGNLSFGVSRIIGMGNHGYFESSGTSPLILNVEEAWNIDKKLDDGLPLSGKIVTQYLAWSVAPLWTNIDRMDDPQTVSTPQTAGTCIDNGGSSGATFKYSLANEDSKNCALSFRF